MHGQLEGVVVDSITVSLHENSKYFERNENTIQSKEAIYKNHIDSEKVLDISTIQPIIPTMNRLLDTVERSRL